MHLQIFSISLLQCKCSYFIITIYLNHQNSLYLQYQSNYYSFCVSNSWQFGGQLLFRTEFLITLRLLYGILLLNVKNETKKVRMTGKCEHNSGRISNWLQLTLQNSRPAFSVARKPFQIQTVLKFNYLGNWCLP